MSETSRPLDTHSLPWMPLGQGVSARPLRFGGEHRTLQLKVEPGVTIGRHRHDGEVHACNVSGSRLLDSGEIAGPGAYVYEPPGNVDSWSCVGDEPCIVQITMTGRLSYIDDHDEVTGYMDTARLRQEYLDWCRERGHVPVALGAR